MERVAVGGPYFEDLKVGDVFDGVPAITIGPAHAALHAAICGDRLALSIDGDLCRAVTGDARLLVHPMLLCNVGIGATTEASQRVLANLFYRRAIMHPVRIGQTVRTRTEVVGLKQNTRRPGRPATGLAALKVDVSAGGRTVLSFWRCPMIPLRDPDAQTGHADDLDQIESAIADDELDAAVPRSWCLDRFRERVGGPRWQDLTPGTVFALEAADTVTSAPELVRLTLNMAAAHVDARATGRGRRLVYGGHTIAIAAAQASRAIPGIVTIVAWRSCDHVGPVFEGDRLRTDIEVEHVRPLSDGALVDLRARTASSGDDPGAEDGDERAVLDWRFVAWVA